MQTYANGYKGLVMLWEQGVVSSNLTTPTNKKAQTLAWVLYFETLPGLV